MHIPVLAEETVRALTEGREGGWWLDATVGAGGHASMVLEATGGESRLLGLDQDGRALEAAGERLAVYGDRVRLVRANFREMAAVAASEGIGSFRGILMDLGVSSMQLDEGERGFSFRVEAPLDMRMDRRGGRTAREVLEEEGEAELARIFKEWGEEPAARRVARAIVEARAAGRLPETTTGLAELVERAKGGRRGRIHPATQVFQALRIAVNDELGALEAALPAALGLLETGGRMGVISFHSLEDRIAKRFFAAHEGRMVSLMGGGERWAGVEPRVRRITRKPVTAGAEEEARNPRSRSAKLRVAERQD